MQKNIAQIIFALTIFFIGAFVTVAEQNIYQRSLEKARAPSSYLTETTASTTIQGPARRNITYFDTPYALQGGCYAFKDVDGIGFTYLTTNNGVATFSSVSCE